MEFTQAGASTILFHTTWHGLALAWLKMWNLTRRD